MVEAVQDVCSLLVGSATAVARDHVVASARLMAPPPNWLSWSAAIAMTGYAKLRIAASYSPIASGMSFRPAAASAKRSQRNAAS